MQVNHHIDAIGLYCPVPARLTRLAILRMAPGQVLEVLADDPDAKLDIPAIVYKLNATLLEIEQLLEDEIRFVIQRT